MSDAQGRARGRSRGRAKPPTQGAPPAPRGPGPAGPAPRGPGPSGPPPGPSSGPPPGLPRPAGPPPGMAPPKAAPSTSGRAMHRGAGRPVDEAAAGLAARLGHMSVAGGGNGSSGNGNGNGNGSGGNGAPVGRGNMRGKRQIFVTIKTKPDLLTTKKGTTGQPVMLQANYFSLVDKPNWCLQQYRVDFVPSIDLTGERKKLMRVGRDLVGAEYIFDGTVLYTRQYHEQLVFHAQRESDDTQVQVTVRHVGELMIGDGHYLQFFNILTRKCLNMLQLQVINRDYYDPRAKVVIPEHNLELWPGYRTVIRQHERDVLMCAEITHKVMRTDNCYTLLVDIGRRNARDYKADYNKAIVGSVVLTDYNNKTYTITDVNWNDNPDSTFDRNGTRVSYVNYYRERYNIAIREKNQPLLVSKSKPRERRAIEQQAVEHAGSGDPNIIFLIPELCRLTGITDEMRSNFNLMRAMANHTRIGAEERVNRLMIMNRRLNGEERIRAEFTNWSLRLADRLVEVPGRILPQENIVLGNNITVLSGDEADWTRHLRSNPMFSMPQGGLSKWVIMFPSRVGRDVEEFVNTLIKAANGMRFQLSQPEYIEVNDERTSTYVEKLDQIISNMNPILVFIVLLNNKADRYSALKKKSLVDRAVPTQCLLAKNLNKKGVMSIATKVAIQMNCKIGGAPWSVTVPLGGLMVVGFDVCHDSKSKGKSYGAMVASLNKPMSRYFSAVSHHSTGEELSNDLALNIVKALHSYKKHNDNRLPSHIMIFRDGVGDGQIPYVFQREVLCVQTAINEVYGSTSAKLGFIIVSKKINTRLFANKGNPKPGTVVDDVITLPERYDFFIISQFVNQGTVSPTSYNVIHDTLGLDPDKVQRLTYKLTHCYYNWSGTVRVPAPVQYAHKLAFLVSQALYRPPNAALSDLLYFL